MSARESAVAALLRKIIGWAESDPDIRRLLLVGSRAREANPDELADVDVQVYSQRPDRFTDDQRWLSDLGDVAVCVRDEYADGIVRVPTRLVVFTTGAKIDFAFYPAGALSTGIRAGLPYRTLVDKDPGDPAASAIGMRRAVAPPDATEFRRVVDEFWFEAYHVAKYGARGEMWLAAERDWATNQFLLRMICWHERYVRGRIIDQDDEGKRATMADDTWQGLQRSLADFDSRMDLFRRLATETAPALGFTYPADVDSRLSALIESIRHA